MHQLVEDHIEDLLAAPGLPPDHPAARHLEQCQDCGEMVSAMRAQSELFAEWRLPDSLPGQFSEDLEPAPGFYARVMDRIDQQRPLSVWDVFFESMIGRRLATVSLAFAIVMGVFLVTSEQSALPAFPTSNVVAETYPMLPSADFPDEVFTSPVFLSRNNTGDLPSMAAMVPNRDAVLLNLVTYRER